MESQSPVADAQSQLIPSNAAPASNAKIVLPTLAFSKPPRPALPRPWNISAYTKPDDYALYIEQVLTPPTADAARSSLTTMLDSDAQAQLRKENGAQFDDMVANEIKQQLRASEVWVRNKLFGKAIPPDFSEIFLDCKAWNRKQAEFSTMPDFTELGMKKWLNDITKMLGDTFQHHTAPGFEPIVFPAERSWSKCTANSAPTGGTISRKPDICLFDHDISLRCDKKDIKPGWALVKAFAEVTQNQSHTISTMMKNIVDKAYLMLESQPFRRFIIALAFIKKETQQAWALVLIDRSGIISTHPFSFSDTSGVTLAMVIYVLGYRRPHDFGIDESMTVDKLTGVVTHITVVGQTPTSGKKEVKRIFEVVRPLHAVVQLAGRATRVWLVRRKGRYYVLKDSWPLKSKPFSEIRHLLTINITINKDPEMYKKLKHTYPILIVGQELKHDTGAYRQELNESVLPRVHRRMVTKPFGDPLTSFNSKFQLCSVLCDTVACKLT